MAKNRLLMRHKNMLNRFAKQNVTAPKEAAKRARAYERAAKLVRADVEKKYPPADMEMLVKYSVAKPDTCINGGSPTGQFIAFEFENTADAPMVPNRYCSTRSIPFTKATVEAIEKYDLAKTEDESAKEKILADYRGLIDGSRYFEDLLQIWPGAEVMRERICAKTHAISILSEETIERIRSHNIEAQQEAA